MESVEKLLTAMKRDSRPEDLVLLVESADLRNLVAAWPRIGVVFEDPQDAPPAEASAHFDWLWSHCTYSADRIALLTRSPMAPATLVEQAKILRLIFPDGTISDFATQFLRRQMVDAIKARK